MNNQETKKQSGGRVIPELNRADISPETGALARTAVDSAFAVHGELGPGLLATAYEGCFVQELELRGIQCQRQLPVPLNSKATRIEVGFRADVIIEQKLLVELKAVETVLPVLEAQVITCLKMLRQLLGLLINFKAVRIQDGIERILNVRRGPPTLVV